MGLDRLRLVRQNMASSAETEGVGVVQQRVGRRRSTTRHQIADVAIELFAARGFDEVSVEDVAHATGIARRTLFRYYPSKNAILWGEFDAHLQHLRELLSAVDPSVSTEHALRSVHDVLGGDRIAIMERRVLAKLELNRGIVHLPPGTREQRLDLERVRFAVHQPVPGMKLQDEPGALGVVVEIHIWHRIAPGDPQCVG